MTSCISQSRLLGKCDASPTNISYSGYKMPPSFQLLLYFTSLYSQPGQLEVREEPEAGLNDDENDDIDDENDDPAEKDHLH